MDRLVIAILVAATLLVAAATGTALGRPQSLDLTCAQARDLVQRAGAVTISTGRHTYERFVADQGFCARMEVTRPGYAPTRDTGNCFVGYRCEPVMIRRQKQ